MAKAGTVAASRLRLTRRAMLRAIGGIAITGIARPAVALQRDISFTLPWIPEGPNLITFVAKANGYWSKAGLNVDIAKGSGSVGAAQARQPACNRPPWDCRSCRYLAALMMPLWA